METKKIYLPRKDLLRNLPRSPGVYIFFSADKIPLYVGKAKNLKDRVGSYFNKGLAFKTSKMINSSRYLETIKVGTELEALLLEAKLVRKHLPKYNIELRDDKSPLYIVITDEKYPRILTARKRDLSFIPKQGEYGPFTYSSTVKTILRHIRKVFPYSTHRLEKRPCVESQIGLCVPCPSYIEMVCDKEFKTKLAKEYKRNISKIKKILSGEIEIVRKLLNAEMRSYSKNEKFEEAQKVRSQIEDFNYLTEPLMPPSSYILDPNLIEDIHEKETQDLYSILKEHINLPWPKRIECFDVAHLAGTFPTASMITFVNGEKETKFYRQFNVKKEKKEDDASMMKTIIKRRMRHINDWGEPDLIVVDGGKIQVKSVVEEVGETVPVIGLAKKFETIVIKKDKGFIEIRLNERPALRLLQRLRDEAHRFARKYHHRLIARQIQKLSN